MPIRRTCRPQRTESDGGNAFDIRRDFRNGTHIGRSNDAQPERTKTWTRLPFALPAYSLYL